MNGQAGRHREVTIQSNKVKFYFRNYFKRQDYFLRKEQNSGHYYSSDKTQNHEGKSSVFVELFVDFWKFSLIEPLKMNLKLRLPEIN